MKYLFIHQNYPGQFKHLAPAIAAIPGNQVVAIVDDKNKRAASIQKNVTLYSYPAPQGSSKETHWYLRNYEGAIRRGQQVVRLLMELRDKQKFIPDVICAHAGWGEALFLKEVFPDAVVLDYFEFFYLSEGSDVGFDKEFQTQTIDDFCRIRIKNSTHLLSLNNCDWGLAPTKWQAGQFPPIYQSKISVIHEGVDTDIVKPNIYASFKVPQGPLLTAEDKVITFVNRNLEPYRGFHVFMRALPQILIDNPDAHVVLLGGDEVSYGAMPKEGGTWRHKMMAEVGDGLDMKRVHFVGKIPYDQYLNLLQISSAHVYLTYPFVLSWSMMESMAAGCIVIASNTPPVTEVMTDGHDGLLFDFFDVQGLVDKVGKVLKHPEDYAQIRINARKTIVEQYDLKTVCLPKQVELLQTLSAKGALQD
ncbi:glycosyl transferase family 1 [Methylovorus sp. MM2]|uniref:glycosyltransferase family 4 protein n=1 Tax=Methylovorus sp. MM2 TaxID=1848038 RepID=UPI0007E14C34|nr:glycosyltransferase family 4 protein [Methylovorus sp. MM2]OAM51321.1 glycosyl transferase family 1 [Methylovorus sp. MM2]